MSNPRSASNAWAKIKTKLIIPAADGTVPATPKKAGARKKAVAEEDGGEGAATPKKSSRKRVSKKQDIDGDSSPKKKPARGKKASDDESEYMLLLQPDTYEQTRLGLEGMKEH
jgi:hypothetical protein